MIKKVWFLQFFFGYFAVKALKSQSVFKSVFFSVLIIAIVVFIINSCSSMSGSFNLDPSFSSTQRQGNSEIIQFPEGTSIPEGYSYLTTAEYKTGLITVECDFQHMVSEAKKITIKSGGDAFRLYNIKAPDYITNTCYTCNILILKKTLNE